MFLGVKNKKALICSIFKKKGKRHKSPDIFYNKFSSKVAKKIIKRVLKINK
jgi:hypothetical protein